MFRKRQLPRLTGFSVDVREHFFFAFASVVG